MDKPKQVNLRHEARKLAMQALYAWQLSENTMHSIKLALFDHDLPMFPNPKKFDEEYFHEIVDSIVHRTKELDELLQTGLDRDIKQLNPVEHAILRIGLFELKYRPEIPYRVVLNEGIILAKKFGALDSHKYVNGVLDKLTQKLRQSEIKPKVLASLEA